MKMFEIDPQVMDPNGLNEKVQAKALAANMQSSFDDEPMEMFSAINPGLPTSRQLRAQMMKVYDSLHKMDASWEIQEYHIHSERPVIGPLIVFAKKVVRKLTRWMFRPYIDQLNSFHVAATVTISEMIRLQEMLISAEEKREKE